MSALVNSAKPLTRADLARQVEDAIVRGERELRTVPARSDRAHELRVQLAALKMQLWKIEHGTYDHLKD